MELSSSIESKKICRKERQELTIDVGEEWSRSLSLVLTPYVLPSSHGGKKEAKLGNSVLPSMGLGKERRY